MNLDTILNIMSKYNLTADEVLLVYLTFLSCSDNGTNPDNIKYFNKWYSGGGKDRLKSLFESLKAKKVILANYNPDTYDPDEIEFNKHFLKQYFKLSGELGKELLKAYPKTLTIGNKLVYLTNISKKFLDQNEFYFWYAASIGHDIQTHKEILEILDWAKSQNLITFSIIEFVGSKKWETFKELKSQGISGQATTFELYSD